MQFKHLGDSDLRVSNVGLGTMGLGGWYDVDVSMADRAIALIRKAMDLGINLFDTAEVYAKGYAEELLGKAVAGCRDEVILSSKFAAGNSRRADVVSAAEGSLRRLGTEYIDIYQNHWPAPNMQWDETLRGLEDLVHAGKIRYIALSNITTYDLGCVLELLPSGIPLIAVQQEYSLSERYVEHSILPACQAAELALIAYSPLARGALCDPDNVKKLKNVADKYGLTPAQASLQWVCRQGDVVAIPMTSKSNHLEANAAALDCVMNDEDLQLLSDTFLFQLEELETALIDVVDSHTGKVFTNLEEAKKNTLGLSPSPMDLAMELVRGEILKPVKVRKAAGSPDRFELFEGQLRYWAWTIAHDGKKPILAQVVS